MLGDFNTHDDVANPSRNIDVGEKLNSFLESNNLAQLIAEPTRVTFNSSTILDLVITNCPERFSASGTLSPPPNCDHCAIFASMNLFTHRSRSYKRCVSICNEKVVHSSIYITSSNSFVVEHSLRASIGT